MKEIISYKWSSLLLALLSITFTACNKENESEHAMQVLISGYNGSGNALQVSIDTTIYDVKALNGNFIIKPASLLQFNSVYTYFPGQQQRMAVLTDTVTKQVVFSKPLPATGTKANFNFLLIDGKEVEVPAQTTDTSTNKLSFYIRYPENDAAIDIFLYKIDNVTGEEERIYLAKAVTPNTWIHVNYTANTVFGSKSLLESTSICFTKAGSTDQWAFQDDEYKSKMAAGGLSFPLTGEKGLVQSYFLLPGNAGLERVRLFFYLDRIW